jgi:predicted permease
MEKLLKDTRYAVRMLMKSPGFTMVAVLSLALGIGVNTAIFTVVNAVLLRPMPVERPEELVEIYTYGDENYPQATSSYLDYVDLRDQNDVFSGLVAHSMMFASFSRDTGSQLLMGELVTGNYFDVMGIEPVIGRDFLPEEDQSPGTHPVAILNYGFWQREFGADQEIIGQTFKMNGTTYTVVGVAPPEFTGTLPGVAPELWLPMMMVDEVEPSGMIMQQGSESGEGWLDRRGYRYLFMKGRLKPEASLEQARAQVETIMARLEQQYPDTNEDRSPILMPASDVRIHPMIDSMLTPVAGVMMGVVAMVLLIACANVANMLLARASARAREIALRMALGSGRLRLVTQLLTESVMLAVLGGAVGLLLAYWTTRLIAAFEPPGPITLSLDLGIDVRVFGFAFLVSLATGVVFGLLPALRASRPDLVTVLKDEATAVRGGFRLLSLRSLLVVAQVAVSLVLLVGAALLVRSARFAEAMDLGFDDDRLAYIGLDLEMNGYSDEQIEVFYRDAVARMETVPGIESVSLAQRIPLDININQNDFYIEGHEPSADDPTNTINVTRVDPAYFETAGVPILRGRGFTDAETEDSPVVAVINEAMADRFWPNENPVGKRIRRGDVDGPEVEIIGVAANHKIVTVGEDPTPYVHLAWWQFPSSFTYILFRTSGDSALMLDQARREILALDPDLTFVTSEPMRYNVALKLAPVRMGAGLLGIFGLLALALASVGLYGVIAYSVSRRTHEIGIRMALGAKATEVMKLVVRQGMALAVIGVVLGLLLAVAMSRVLATVLYGTSAVDVMAFSAAALLLLAVAFLANYVPARRAAHVDPMEALRYE